MQQQHGLEFCGVKHCKGQDCRGGNRNASYEKAWSLLEKEEDLLKKRSNLLEREKEFELEKLINDRRAYARMKELADQRSLEALKEDERMAAKKLKKRNMPKTQYRPFDNPLNNTINAAMWAFIGPIALNLGVMFGSAVLGVSAAPTLAILSAGLLPTVLVFALVGYLRSKYYTPKKKKRKKRKSRRR